MKRKNKGAAGIAIIAIVVVLVIFFGGQWNNLVKLDEDVNSAWAQVENQVKRRADLIPNIVETVKGYASHEKETFTEITKARAGVSEAKNPKELAEANEELSQAVREINVVAEDYPDLKANTQYTQLMDELAGSENRISVERGNYNQAVKEYNSDLKRFPTNLIAGITGYKEAEYFQASEKAQDAPTVDFNSDKK